MKKNQSNITSEKIGLFEKIAYGGGDLASNLILVLSSTFVTFFYTDALGLNAAIIGMIMMVSRFLDGTSLILMFTVPQTGDFGKYVYVAITYNLVTTILYTAINIPYGALTSLMSRDQDQRMVINIFRMTMAQIGSLIINAITLPIVNSLGGSGDQKSWIITSVIYGIAALILFLLCFFKTKERVKVNENKEAEQKMSFITSIKFL